MWACLSLLLPLCLLHGGRAESEGVGPRCQLPPAWNIGEVEPMKGTMGQVTVVALLQASCLFCLVQASRMDSLHQMMESQGLKNVAYMVINHQGEQAQLLHPMLAQRMSENITLYKQDQQQVDVWKTLGGQKDDFLIYDRCGRLTHHISLPYSIIGQGHVEGAIRDTYCNRICGDCTHESTETPEECKGKADVQPDADGTPAIEHNTGHGHHHDHRQVGGVSQRQEHFDLGQMQQAVLTQQMLQEAHRAPVRP
uniref:Selenoprotein P N-terminal domain-containing protein n=1 Tax=Monopterus albus TaxID=43700 RepID=A0A3Q3K960_MONAL